MLKKRAKMDDKYTIRNGFSNSNAIRNVFFAYYVITWPAIDKFSRK